jgi:hypothetical protein
MVRKKGSDFLNQMSDKEEHEESPWHVSQIRDGSAANQVRQNLAPQFNSAGVPDVALQAPTHHVSKASGESTMGVPLAALQSTEGAPVLALPNLPEAASEISGRPTEQVRQNLAPHPAAGAPDLALQVPEIVRKPVERPQDYSNDPDDAASDHLSLGSGTTEGNLRLFRRIKHVQDKSVRAVLNEWLYTAGEQTQEKDALFLGQTLPATMLFNRANISSTILYLLVRDILKDRGHDVSHIQADTVREGISRALYHIEDEPPSRDAQLSAMAIRDYVQERDAEYQCLIAEMTSRLDSKVDGKISNPGNGGAEPVLNLSTSLPPTEQGAYAPNPAQPGDDDDGSSSSDEDKPTPPPIRERDDPDHTNASRGIPSTAFKDTGKYSREVQAISTAFKSSSSKFSGDLDENISEFLREYEVVSRNLALPDQRKFDLLHNLFRDDAKEWFFQNIAEHDPITLGGYEGAVAMLKKEYHSRSRQERIKQLLECLTFEQFVEGDGTHQDIKRALDKLKTKIIKLTQQCSLAFRGPEHQLSHLRRAVVGQPWSELPLQASPPYRNMNQLVAALGAAIQHDATKAALTKMAPNTKFPTFYGAGLRNPTYGRTRWEKGKLVPTHQKSYGCAPSQSNASSSQKAGSKVRARSWIDVNTGLLKPDPQGHDRACHKCGGRDHLSFEVERCDPAKAMTHIATRFSTGDSAEEVCMDLLDDQLMPEELIELLEETGGQGEVDDDGAAAFTRAFETRFASRLEDRLSHVEGRD